ncbi:MAG: UDP-N-acetylglucosamine--N-acetylmuramyl-(pentapeptide) pyrophosphoryl-undecaprenol N-acetylglucosamine transferase [Candidatus Pacebacteria bacterium]|jgi:UDP-N-acetylglucosamine--N-acetylmuramyl-(pentapeptide) pyrophosphoryl-undecaprenol N-acetylglucosamine transferase|nr:UDP-N-acetylglucosamine--N-acetylmuramyl-(pentapeptide) pyrophosphoryl-undecaprenol N-acetylglucosamine transferase [Candidatus Paceibacterota bacterium]
MRILLAGESTAGSLAPLVSVYEALKVKTKEENIHETVEFMLISTESDFLKAFVQNTEIEFKILNPEQENMKTSFFTSFKNFTRIMSDVFNYMPDVIFLKGGFVSLPVAMVGKLFAIPVIMHESDTAPSGIDKFISHFAKRIAISFNLTKEFYPAKKIFFSGNPVSPSVAMAGYEESKQKFSIEGDKPVIFVMGGSHGAHEINELIMQILPQLLEKYEIIHQCGIADYEAILARVQQMNIPLMEDYHLFPFMQQSLANAYAACDLVVSRAGANTVAEIMLVGKPSVLIPMSDSESDNQNRNAFFYSEAGAAILVNEKNLKPHLFLDILNGIFKDKLKIMEMMRQARLLAHPEAADVVADEILKWGK